MGTLLVAGLVLVCPLMMIVMMRGMSSGDMASRDDLGHDRHPARPDGPDTRVEQRPDDFGRVGRR